ncbi:MAG: methylmalonyl-CoA mutase [Deltaproteobacteria bacterium]|nr:MAG: methylmalonyl-CoA mutase [Deltaproteobacteria bacterium]
MIDDLRRVLEEEKLKRLKKERNALQVQRALDAITQCCDEDRNLMKVIVESVKAYVTEGEISGALKRSYGTWDPPLF